MKYQFSYTTVFELDALFEEVWVARINFLHGLKAIKKMSKNVCLSYAHSPPWEAIQCPRTQRPLSFCEIMSSGPDMPVLHMSP